jgi:hypothetical protein
MVARLFRSAEPADGVHMAIRSAFPVLAAGMVVLSAGDGRADPYRDATHHFSLKLPAGWTRVPAQALAAANAMVRGRGFGQIQYTAGFQRTGRPPLEYPYVLVQFQSAPADGMTYEEMEVELAKAGQAMDQSVQQVKDKMSDLGKDVSISRPTIDRAKNQFVAKSRMDVMGVGPVAGHSIGIVGKDGIVFLHCYTKAADMDNRLSTFNAIADSFQYDKGYEFVPGSGRLAGLPIAWSGGMIGAVAGAVVGGLVGVAVKLSRPARAS